MRPLLPALVLSLFLLSAAVGCQEKKPVLPPPNTTGLVQNPTNIPFRKDGELTFYRDGGEDIARIAIEIADTDSATQRGLMQRESLPPESGMLFIMPQTRIQAFYMANTPMPLDIIFVGPDSTLVSIAKDTQPYSTANVISEAPAKYVVEVPAGYSTRLGLTAGDRIRWTRMDG